MTRTPCAAAILGLAILILPGCSGGDDPGRTTTDTAAPSSSPAPGATPQAPANPDPATSGTALTQGGLSACTLVSAEDLQRITGTAFSPGTTTDNQLNVNQCAWNLASTGAGGITIAIYSGNIDVPLDQYQSMPGMESVPDIGEQAWWNEQLNEIVVRKGDRAAVVSFNYPGQHRTSAVEIARQAAAKL